MNRRNVLKGIGVGAASLGVASSVTAADRNDVTDAVLETEMVADLLAAAGNPNVVSTKTVAPALEGSPSSDENTLFGTEIRTENGSVAVATVEGPKETTHLPGYFEFDADGMAYDETENTLYVISEERGRFGLDLGRAGPYLHRTLTSVVESGEYTTNDVTTHGDDCFDLFGPCPACVAGTAACAGCAATCVTGPQCAACLILTCGITGGACGCCALCADGIPDPENAVCPD